METLIQIPLLLLLVLLSAFFSGSETALFSIKKADLHRMSMSTLRLDRAIYRVMAAPQKILITILIGNLFVNLILSALSTRILLKIWGDFGHFISIAIVTPLVILFCEISPKVIAIQTYMGASRRVYPLLQFFHQVFIPIRVLLLAVSDMIIRVFRLSIQGKTITEEELDHAVKIGEQEGVLDKDEGTIIKNVMRFSKKEAANIMFPRNRAVFIPAWSTIEETMNICLEKEVIRAPVFSMDLDHVIGMIDTREMMPYYLGYKKGKSIKRFIKDIDFFPASRELRDLLKDFLDKGIQLAVLVDEYGGTAGVVTLNSIISQIMGREFTKWEIDRGRGIKKINDDVSVIPGKMQIDHFNVMFDERAVSTETETIGGYVTEILGHLPRRGDQVSIGRYDLRVRHVRDKRIQTLEISRRGEASEEGE